MHKNVHKKCCTTQFKNAKNFFRACVESLKAVDFPTSGGKIRTTSPAATPNYHPGHFRITAIRSQKYYTFSE